VSTARVDFTRGAAERIANVVRIVEQGDRDGDPLTFRRVGLDGGRGARVLRFGTVSGPWDKGAEQTITFINQTATPNTVTAINLLCDVGTVQGSAETLVAIARDAGSWYYVNHECVSLPGFCGTYKGPDLISLSFDSCHGASAAARVTDPGGKPDEDKGPISKVSLTNGGSKYALLGRVEPTLKITGGGVGETFTAAMSKQTGDCDIPYWEVGSVSLSKTGGGYVDGEQLTVTPTAGAVAELAANLTLGTVRSEPSLTALAQGGSGASLTVATKSLGGSPSTWGISGVSVSSGGSGYGDNAEVSISKAANVVVQEGASVVARTKRDAPTFEAQATGGFGASLTPVLSQSTDGDGRAIWGVASLTISEAGSKYEANTPIFIGVTNGKQIQAASGTIGSVHTATGAILTALVTQPGIAFKDTGVIDIAVVKNGGIYYAETPDSVKVNNGGRYYLEDPAASPYVASVTVKISQTSPSDGSGAVLTAVVNNDTGSTAFGQISGLTITNGGDGYLAWEELSKLDYAGVSFADIDGYERTKTQLLGHEAEGCLKWFDTVDCEEEEEPEE
jgi:hypothetical protein